MKKLSVCVLFGGISPEHEVSLRSAEFVLNSLDPEKYNVFPVGITKNGDWILDRGNDYSLLPTGEWMNYPENRRAAISPVRGQGLLSFEGDCVVREWIDVVFPVLHGENGEDGAMQGLLQMAGIPYVGPHVAASAVAMDKTLTKLVVDQAQIRQAAWMLVRNIDAESRMDWVLEQVEKKFQYPVFVKPAGTGSSVGVSKAADRDALRNALLKAGSYDSKILVEEFIHGREVEVAVMGNNSPVASICGEIDSGAEFYDYDAKYVYAHGHTQYFCPPVSLSDEEQKTLQTCAERFYQVFDCRDMVRVDFILGGDDHVPYILEGNSLPGFTATSLVPKAAACMGVSFERLCARLVSAHLQPAAK